MRLGGPIFETYTDPDAWIAAVQRRGYRFNLGALIAS